MRISQLIVSLSLAVPIVGLADEPAVSTSSAVTAAISGSTSAVATDPSARDPVEKTPAQLKKEALEAKIKKNGLDGFKPEKTKSGDTLYCKTEAPIGSRFETKQCRTYEQLQSEALQGKEYLENAQHVIPPAGK